MVLGNKFSRFPLPLQQPSQPYCGRYNNKAVFFSVFFFSLCLPHRLLQKTVPVARVRAVDGDAPSRGPFVKTGRYQREHSASRTGRTRERKKKKTDSIALQLPET
ncbi:hypothetical protein FVEG_14934 [Fusarium verticillioides 7600]|uniref:Uncharacterized protein n=1 Tax=Gibberella moniliformis (strain M3125 / FGSC 7600) TaxID=334819 RepID=W7LJH4_GIBM7|nr:hypothetical protein FVEG_14934 [Fusarium verticillioides 7600]EWG38651.1 hypothetical protein FVEG_14934 [Fusarium verticillioides 7600]